MGRAGATRFLFDPDETAKVRNTGSSTRVTRDYLSGRQRMHMSIERRETNDRWGETRMLVCGRELDEYWIAHSS